MAAVIVVGGGVIGLSTALELLEAGHDVAVWTRDEISATVSAVAAAVWYPFLAEPRDRVLAWSGLTFDRLVALAELPESGVSVQRLVELFSRPDPDLWWLPDGVDVCRVDVRAFGRGYATGIELGVPLCDTNLYLPWLAEAVRARGGVILRRTVASLEEPLTAAPIVINCTGLGARELCSDASLQPVRGQVVSVAPVELPFSLIDDTDAAQPVYVLPRGDDVVLGGTATPGDDRLEADPTEAAAIVAACARRMPQVRAAKVRAVSVGLRPYRPEVRLERDRAITDRCLIHNYGHGGSGFTLAWGCAAEVATLVADAAREVENGPPGCRKDRR